MSLVYKKTLNNSGFSIIEVMVVVAIVVLISSVLFLRIGPVREDRILETSASAVSIFLNETRSYSFSGHNNKNYGAHFDNDKVVRFIAPTYSANNASNESLILDSSLSLSVSLSGGGSDIIWQRITGDPSKVGTTTLTSSVTGKTVQVVVNQSGEAEVK